jgi:hypothetical protein
MMLLARPGREEVAELRTHYPRHWMGFDMGVDLRNPLWSPVIESIARVYVLCPARPWAKPLGEMLTVLRDLRTDVPISLLKPPGEWPWLQMFAKEHDLTVTSYHESHSQEDATQVKTTKKERRAWPIFTKVGGPRRGQNGRKGLRKK